MTPVDYLALLAGVVVLGFCLGVGIYVALWVCEWIARRFE